MEGTWRRAVAQDVESVTNSLSHVPCLRGPAVMYFYYKGILHETIEASLKEFFPPGQFPALEITSRNSGNTANSRPISL